MEKIHLNWSQRDILLMPFPYSNLSGSKVRPVLVISNGQFNASSQDLIVCAVTSNISKDSYTVVLEKNHLEEGQLLEDCCVKIENIAKIEKAKVIKKIGRIGTKTFSEIIEKLYSLFS